MNSKYDYIIAGAGCAGLSLLHRLMMNAEFKDKRILVIDKDSKNQNDRTWCFWEKETGLFEELVHHHWNTLIYQTEEFRNEFGLSHYSYKMIRGIDFYEHILKIAHDRPNIEFLQSEISSISEKTDTAYVETKMGVLEANYVFNSTSLFCPKIDTSNALLQHFKGWVITTKEPKFNPEIGTLMDFSISQEHGDTFMYVLPTSPTEALVEYTLFTPTVLEQAAYDEELKKYIRHNLAVEDFKIKHKEYGIIPMSTASFSHYQKDSNIVHLGTAGGFTKASSGYTFQFIQKHCDEVLRRLKDGKSPNNKPTFQSKKYDWYDRTLLDVILRKKLTGKEVFTTLFKKTDPDKLLAFLGNESTLSSELKLMLNLPILPFLRSGINQLRK